MNEKSREQKADAAVESASPRRAYVPPEIVWREPYDPISFGVSCAKQPGNPSCVGFMTA